MFEKGNMMDGILLINKPVGITSRDVVNMVSKKFNTKKIGHTGTLDPFADGLLVLTIGKGTKCSQFLGLKIRVNINADTTAILIPALVKSNIPKDNPSKPNFLALSIAPCKSKCPKEVIGIIAPPPAYRTILSYIPAISKNAPTITKKLVT